MRFVHFRTELQGHSQRGPWPPNHRLSEFFLHKKLLCWDVAFGSVVLKYAKNALAAGLCPGPHRGSSRRSPIPQVGWEGDLLPNPHAFGAEAP